MAEQDSPTIVAKCGRLCQGPSYEPGLDFMTLILLANKGLFCLRLFGVPEQLT